MLQNMATHQRPVRLAVCLLGGLSVLSCTSTVIEDKVDQVQVREAAAKKPWTNAFLERTGVIADVIEIEGPPALLDHFVGHQNPDFAEYTIEPRPDGMLHIYRRRDVHPVLEVSAQLDAWELSAFAELRVLFAVDDRPVVLRAKGGASARPYAGGEAHVGEVLEFIGDPQAEAAAEEALLQTSEILPGS